MTPKSIGFFLSALLVFSACKKEEYYAGATDKQINIQLNTLYVPASKIDSAILISEWPGLTKRMRLEVKGSKIQTTLNSFAQTGKLTIQLYTKATFNSKPLQFEREISVTGNVPETVEVSGPTSFSDLSWKPRVILDYQAIEARFTAVVALRTSDPYFEILHLPANWDNRLKVFRGFFKDDFTNLVYGHTWDCGNLCSGNIVEREAFKTLPQHVNQLEYNKTAIEVSFYTSPNTIAELAFTYDK